MCSPLRFGVKGPWGSLWWKAFARWSIRKAQDLDGAVHHVTDTPTERLGPVSPWPQMRQGSWPSSLLSSAHTFPSDEFIHRMAPITITALRFTSPTQAARVSGCLSTPAHLPQSLSLRRSTLAWLHPQTHACPSLGVLCLQIKHCSVHGNHPSFLPQH